MTINEALEKYQEGGTVEAAVLIAAVHGWMEGHIAGEHCKGCKFANDQKQLVFRERLRKFGSSGCWRWHVKYKAIEKGAALASGENKNEQGARRSAARSAEAILAQRGFDENKVEIVDPEGTKAAAEETLSALNKARAELLIRPKSRFSID